MVKEVPLNTRFFVVASYVNKVWKQIKVKFFEAAH